MASTVSRNGPLPEVAAELDPHQVLECMPDAVLVVREDGVIARVNAETERLLGYRREELVGQPVELLLPEHARERHAAHRELYGGEPRPMGVGMELSARRRDGTSIPVEISLGPVVLPAGATYVVASVRDVSARRSTEARLHAKTEHLAAIYERAPVGIATLTLDGLVIETNATLAGSLGRAPAALVGTALRALVHPADADAHAASDAQLVAGELDDYRLEQRFVRDDGTVWWAAIAASVVKDANGSPEFLLVVIEDVTERKWAEQELRLQAARSAHQAFHDVLTGLPNRALFADRAEQALLSARRDGRQLALLLADVDGFKEINDTHGHATGDHVLTVTAERMQGCLRATDTVARLGGDEFAFVLTSDELELERVLAHLAAAAEAAIVADGVALHVSWSVGAAVFPEDGNTIDALLRRADAAMYAAKREHHDRRG